MLCVVVLCSLALCRPVLCSVVLCDVVILCCIIFYNNILFCMIWCIILCFVLLCCVVQCCTVGVCVVWSCVCCSTFFIITRSNAHTNIFSNIIPATFSDTESHINWYWYITSVLLISYPYFTIPYWHSIDTDIIKLIMILTCRFQPKIDTDTDALYRFFFWNKYLVSVIPILGGN